MSQTHHTSLDSLSHVLPGKIARGIKAEVRECYQAVLRRGRAGGGWAARLPTPQSRPWVISSNLGLGKVGELQHCGPRFCCLPNKVKNIQLNDQKIQF